MALIKALLTPYGAEATYFRIIQVNQNADRLDLFVAVHGYVDEAARRSGKDPLQSVTFNFSPEDHPLSELDADIIETDRLSDWRNFDYHLLYQHIKAICALAVAKRAEGMELTSNEQTALIFEGYENAY